MLPVTAAPPVQAQTEAGRIFLFPESERPKKERYPMDTPLSEKHIL
jgi:hypothetical protein